MNATPLEELRVIRDAVVPAVVAAGRWIRAKAAQHVHDAASLSISSKSEVTDLVTAVDLEVEARLRDTLLSTYPSFGLLGEEGSSVRPDAKNVWVLDPLDGTRNFVLDHSGYCVSLGLVAQGRSELGIVYDIAADELYTAVRGGGAYLNGRRLRVSTGKDLALSTVGVGFTPSARAQPELVAAYVQLLQGTAALRQSGAAARDLAYVARGSLDAFWQSDLKQWDLAAGMLLVEEAGGSVLAVCDDPADWLHAAQLGVIAGNPAVQRAVEEIVNG